MLLITNFMNKLTKEMRKENKEMVLMDKTNSYIMIDVNQYESELIAEITENAIPIDVV